MKKRKLSKVQEQPLGHLLSRILQELRNELAFHPNWGSFEISEFHDFAKGRYSSVWP